MKSTINPRFLVNTAVVFNKAKTNAANNLYYVAIVRGCVKTQDKARMNIGVSDTAFTRDDIVMFDAIGSIATGKVYAKPREWTLMPDADKLTCWTLRNDDEILIIKTGDELPVIENNPMSEDKFDTLKSGKWEIRRITDNSVIQDKHGNEVVRTITLGA
jgi:hypothetical protein